MTTCYSGLLSGHGKVVCKICEETLLTCKCLLCNKNIVETICEQCLEKEEEKKKAEINKTNPPKTASGSYLVFCQTWTEYESGWGQRPDGYTLHLSKEDGKTFADDYEKKYNNKPVVPREYSKPDRNYYLTEIDEDVLDKLKKSKNGIWGGSFGSGPKRYGD